MDNETKNKIGAILKIKLGRDPYLNEIENAGRNIDFIVEVFREEITNIKKRLSALEKI